MNAHRTAHRLTRLSALTALLALGFTGACVNVTTQRWPGPMEQEVRPLPPGDSNLHPPGIEEATVIRHADPVRVRPPGVNSGRPLTFYDKQARMNAGSQIVVAPGGRAEILWPEGSAVVLFGRAVAWLGSPSRGEPMLNLRDVERARVMLGEEDQVQLVGGAMLSGAGGPYLLRRDPNGTLSVHNQSKGGMNVAFRDEIFEMGPGQRVLLPLLSDGGTPFEVPEDSRRIPGPGFTVDYIGEAEPVQNGNSLRLSASEPTQVSGLGIRVRMAPGAQVTFSDLGSRAEETPAEPIAAPVPADPSSEASNGASLPEAAPEGDPESGDSDEDSEGS